MNLLFIGGTGNLSAECAEFLHGQGHEIAVVTRGQSVVPPEYRVIRADRKDLAGFRGGLDGLQPDVVLNFLGYELADVQLDHQLFRSIGQYVFISSATVYAKPPPRLPITEDSPMGNPFWPYAQSKQQCEEWLLRQWQETGFPLTIVRPSLTYSKRWIPNPLSSSSYTFAARLEQGKPVYVPDEGETPWTVTAASDFAAGLAGLIGNKAALGEAFHITGDEVLTWKLIVAEIASALGVTAPEVMPIPTEFICQIAPQMTGTLKGDKAHPGVFDNSKLRRFVPGFVARKPLRAGVRESVTWLRTHPDQQNRNAQLDALCDQITAAWTARSKSP